LALGVALFGVLRALQRAAPRIPAPLVAVALAIAAVYLLRLDQQGVAVVGTVPAGFPLPRVPAVGTSDLGPLALGACGIVLVSFCSMMTTARGFAAKNGYAIDANRDFVALGIADLASGVSGGFVVSGADSRTAVADAAGGKTQLTSIAAAAAMILVLFFLTAPLAYLPNVALAAILISSAIGLFDLRSLQRYRRVSRQEFRSSLVTMIGVITLGVLPGVLIAVGLALLRVLARASVPHDAVLGLVQGPDGIHGAELDAGAKPVPEVILYRFDSSLLFFNAGRFHDRVRAVIAAADQKPKWFLFDAESANLLDLTAADTLEAVRAELAEQGIVLAIARAKEPFRVMLQLTGLAERIGAEHLFPTVHDGALAFQRQQVAATVINDSFGGGAALGTSNQASPGDNVAEARPRPENAV
jgi:MFS superfamily sulfate permease-like transporter